MSDLDLLYGQVPTISGCTGACAASCGPIAFGDAEAARILARMRGLPEPREDLTCSMLNAFGRCDIYEDRPMLCRLWGASEAMPCVFGCTPDSGRLLDRGETRELLRAATEVRS
jgi:hypothetical protein